jgi:hypothetical protein
MWWKVIALNNLEHASCFSVDTSSVSTNFNGTYLRSLLEPCKPNFASSECLVSTFFGLNFVKESQMKTLTLSDPMSDLVRHYDFPVPDAFLDL